MTVNICTTYLALIWEKCVLKLCTIDQKALNFFWGGVFPLPTFKSNFDQV